MIAPPRPIWSVSNGSTVWHDSRARLTLVYADDAPREERLERQGSTLLANVRMCNRLVSAYTYLGQLLVQLRV